MGLEIKADVDLPFGIGKSRFLGILKPGYFLLEMYVDFEIAGCLIDRLLNILLAL